MRETDIKLVAFYSPEEVAEIFGQFLREDVTRRKRDRDGTETVRAIRHKGDPDTRWVYRHSADKHGFLYRATRRRPGVKALLFDRAEIERIAGEFRAPGE